MCGATAGVVARRAATIEKKATTTDQIPLACGGLSKQLGLFALSSAMLRAAMPASLNQRASLHRLLIGSALAGVSTLSLHSGQARALSTPCSFGGNTEATTCVLGVPYDTKTATDKQITLLKTPTTGEGTIEFNWISIDPRPGYLDDLWEVDVDFEQPLQGPASGVFEYLIEITSPNNATWSFDTVRLKADSLSGNPLVTKSIYSDDAFTNEILEIVGGKGFVDLPSGYSKLYVRDSYELQGQSDVLDNFQNVYTQVPGPLPLIGAGTAFAFSRRLRQRARSRHILG